MQFIREKLAGPVSREMEASIAGLLDKDFRPVISGSKLELARLMNLSSANVLVGGDVFVTPQGELLYYLLDEDRSGVVAGVAWDGKKDSAVWKDFQTRISEIIGRRTWKPFPLVSPRFCTIAEDAQPLNVSDWERNAVKVMHNPGMRRLLQVVAGVPSISLQSASEGRSLAEVGAEAQQMDSLGILCREFEVFCRQTHQKVSRVSSLAALDEASGRGFKCFHCGRSISEEQIVQSLTITDEGKCLAKPNMWLVYLVGAALLDRGVPGSNIVYRFERDYRTVEVFADINGAVFMFSLHEEGVSPDSAFRLLTRTRYFDPDFAFLVSPAKISGESIRVMAVDERLVVVDELEKLGQGLDAALLKATRGVIRRVLGDFSDHTTVGLASSVAEYFVGPEPKKEIEAPVVAAEPEEVAAPSVVVAAPVAKEQNTKATTAPVATPAVGTIPAPGPKVQAAKNVAPVPGKPTVAPKVAAPESAPAPDEMAALKAGLAAALGESGAVAGDDELKARVKQIVGKSVYDDTDELDDAVSKISAVPGLSAMIAGSDGMPFLGQMETSDDAEMVAALHFDLISQGMAASEECGLGALKELAICGNMGTLAITPVGDQDMNLLVHRVRSVVEAMPELEGHPSTSKSVLEFRLNKVFGELKSVKGLAQCLVAVSGGDVYASKVVGNVSIPKRDRIADAAERIMGAVTAFMGELSDPDVRSVFVETDKAAYAVVPIQGKGLIVGVMTPESAVNVWRRVFPCVAAYAGQPLA